MVTNISASLIFWKTKADSTVTYTYHATYVNCLILKAIDDGFDRNLLQLQMTKKTTTSFTGIKLYHLKHVTFNTIL